MKKKTVTLDSIEWGQILDGLRCRAEQWEETARYHERGYADSDILEAASTREAETIACFYRSIISKIENQVR